MKALAQAAGHPPGAAAGCRKRSCRGPISTGGPPCRSTTSGGFRSRRTRGPIWRKRLVGQVALHDAPYRLVDVGDAAGQNEVSRDSTDPSRRMATVTRGSMCGRFAASGNMSDVVLSWDLPGPRPAHTGPSPYWGRYAAAKWLLSCAAQRVLKKRILAGAPRRGRVTPGGLLVQLSSQCTPRRLPSLLRPLCGLAAPRPLVGPLPDVRPRSSARCLPDEQPPADAARQEAARAEAARLEAERQEETRQAVARQEAAQQEAARQEAARAEAARVEAERQQAERQAAARREAAQEAARQEAAQGEAARQAAARQEAAGVQAAQEAEEKRQAARRALGRQLDEEAARRDAASNAARPPGTLPYSLSGARRGDCSGIPTPMRNSSCMRRPGPGRSSSTRHPTCSRKPRSDRTSIPS